MIIDRTQFFLKRFPGGQFPGTREIKADEVTKLRTDLAGKASMHSGASFTGIVGHIWQTFKAIHDFKAVKDDFNLRAALASQSINPKDEVFVYWDNREQLDAFTFDDLSDKFKGLWIPTMDDIMIFDNTISWVLYIKNSGDLMLTKF